MTGIATFGGLAPAACGFFEFRNERVFGVGRRNVFKSLTKVHQHGCVCDGRAVAR